MEEEYSLPLRCAPPSLRFNFFAALINMCMTCFRSCRSGDHARSRVAQLDSSMAGGEIPVLPA